MKKIYIIIPIFLLVFILSACSLLKSEEKNIPALNSSSLTEEEARLIAEAQCLQEGDSLTAGFFNENSKTWWFGATLGSTPEGCNPACVVFEETSMAEINWRCTGLIAPENSVNDTIKQLFSEKYPQYAETLSVDIKQEDENHLRGEINFEIGAPGGIFLATKTNDVWEIVFDGNGAIPCSLVEYGFSEEMLSDCSDF